MDGRGSDFNIQGVCHCLDLPGRAVPETRANRDGCAESSGSRRPVRSAGLRARRCGLPCLVLALISCNRPEPSRTAPATARDSTGIRIVENVAEVWDSATAWRLSDAPVLELGAGIEGDRDQQFANLQSVMLLPDTTVLVADAGNFVLSRFDFSGRLVSRAGGSGSGPGELGSGLMQRIFRCAGDSIFVSGRDRITVFAPTGEFERTFRLQLPTGHLAAAMLCMGNRIVANTRYGTWPTAPGVYRDSMLLGLYSTTGEFHGTMGPLPEQDRTYIRALEGVAEVGFHPTPFGRRLAIAGMHGVLATGIGDVFEIRLNDSTGALRGIVRVTSENRPLTDGDIQRYRDFVLPDYRGNAIERRELERELEAAKLPATMPAFADFAFDASGNLWVRSYDHFDAVSFHNYTLSARQMRTRALPDEPRVWTVLGPDGTLLGRSTTPPGFIVHDIGAAWIAGIWRDTLDVDHVRVYGIVKPAG